MKAVVYRNEENVAVEDVEMPKIVEIHDAILKVTSAAICGSDLHMYDGRTGIEEGAVFGHEIMGVISEVGEGVKSIKKGDRVVLPFNISCGTCYNCCRGITCACLTTNPDGVGAAYGYAAMGPYRGGQAEYVRVPFADFNCLKVPGRPFDEYEDDFLMLADIFPTGFHGCELANVQPGSTVAIFGAGPVGLLAAQSAFLRGASQVFVGDQSEERLKIAKRIGAIPINFRDGNPSEQIKAIRKKNRLIMDSFRPGEEKMLGVDCGIDAVGYQARSIDDPDQEDGIAAVRQLVKVVNPAGNIGLVGVYMPEDPGAADKKNKEGLFDVPLGEIFEKGLSIRTGQTPVKKYNVALRDLIIAGKAKPSIIISHRIKIDDAPEAYRKFNLRGMGEGSEFTKVILKFDGK